MVPYLAICSESTWKKVLWRSEQLVPEVQYWHDKIIFPQEREILCKFRSTLLHFWTMIFIPIFLMLNNLMAPFQSPNINIFCLLFVCATAEPEKSKCLAEDNTPVATPIPHMRFQFDFIRKLLHSKRTNVIRVISYVQQYAFVLQPILNEWLLAQL